MIVAWAALFCLLGVAHAQLAPAPAGLKPAQLALVINDDEPNSVEIGEYYRQTRNVPAENVVHVRIPDRPRKLDAAQFRQLKEQIDAKLGPHIEAVLMVWTAPYAVECNSITSAYAMGLDATICATPCGPSKPNPYFGSASAHPYAEHGMRLAMLLPTDSIEQAKALIGRGVASGFSTPAASAYYLTTSEHARNSRATFFPRAGVIATRKLTIKRLNADAIENEKDVMVYQTGMARVAKLDTLQFLPGALADSLTSFGGDLLGSAQMSSLRWLDAGATASYGTVSEPCNYWQKFPQPSMLLAHYLRGVSAIEAYWRSVAWPAQGVFIGEPLAAPYRR
ncbi:TIGR03790 family protein [Duganella sacchari]|uniref:TIGR03790 family protein n=1 Tax=Duganella sacchari TaxID=551987 RepID=A0A1M7R0R0_9BURK|nr:TIGR03790 family protein [Duganella sacchari]SHN38003.1 TIGR03790 family protein [Duganella sacchari]